MIGFCEIYSISNLECLLLNVSNFFYVDRQHMAILVFFKRVLLYYLFSHRK
jgi:hypothetical protein